MGIKFNEIIAANSDDFDSASYQEALTQLAVGVSSPSVQELLDFMFPPVQVGFRFEYNVDGGGAFLVDDDDARAPGTAFKTVKYTGKKVKETTTNRGLQIFIDHDEYGGDQLESTVERYTERLVHRLMRNELVRGVKMFTEAAGAGTDVIWSPTKGTRPDIDMRNLARSLADSIGVSADKLVIGEDAMAYRAEAYEGSTAVASVAAANLDLAGIARKCGVQAVMECRQRYESGTGKKKFMNADKVYAFTSRDVIDKDDPSAFKRFYSTCKNGQAFGVYRKDGAKYTSVMVEWYSKLAQTYTGAVKALTVKNA